MALTLERRAFTSELELRETPTSFGVRGYAAVFDSPSHGDVVRSTAFNKTLAERDDVRLLVNHDGIQLGRTKSQTLEVGVDERGLWYDAPGLDKDNPTVQELASAMRRRDIDQSSFAFLDTTPSEERLDEDGLRNIRTAKLYDVSIVTFPWYEDTQAEANALDETFACIRSGVALKREQRDLLVNLLIYEDTDDDMAEDLDELGVDQDVPMDEPAATGEPNEPTLESITYSAEFEAIKAAMRRRRAA